jgi:hypothetical protein
MLPLADHVLQPDPSDFPTQPGATPTGRAGPTTLPAQPVPAGRKSGRGRGIPPPGKGNTHDYPSSTHEHQTTVPRSRRKRADSRRSETLARSRNQFPTPILGGYRARECGECRRPARPPDCRNGGSWHRPRRTDARPGGRVAARALPLPCAPLRVRPLPVGLSSARVPFFLSRAHVRALVFVVVLA